MRLLLGISDRNIKDLVCKSGIVGGNNSFYLTYPWHVHNLNVKETSDSTEGKICSS